MDWQIIYLIMSAIIPAASVGLGSLLVLRRETTITPRTADGVPDLGTREYQDYIGEQLDFWREQSNINRSEMDK